MENKNGFEIVAQGAFVDEGCWVKTFVVRLFGDSMEEWDFGTVLDCRECYETDKEWQLYLKGKKAARAVFEAKMRVRMDLNDCESFVMTQTVSEIFTVVAMFPLTERRAR